MNSVTDRKVALLFVASASVCLLGGMGLILAHDAEMRKTAPAPTIQSIRANPPSVAPFVGPQPSVRPAP